MKDKQKCINILTENGYEIKGNKVIAPDADSPLDAISIQDQLSDNGYRLQYVGDTLKLVDCEKL